MDGPDERGWEGDTGASSPLDPCRGRPRARRGVAAILIVRRRRATHPRHVAQKHAFQGQGRRKVAGFFDAGEHRCALCGFTFPRRHSHEERRRHEKSDLHVGNHATYLRLYEESAIEFYEEREREIARVGMERKRAAVDETVREHGAAAWESHFDDRFKAALFDEMRRACETHARGEAPDAFTQFKSRVRVSLLERAALGVFGQDERDRSFLLARLVAQHVWSRIDLYQPDPPFGLRLFGTWTTTRLL